MFTDQIRGAITAVPRSELHTLSGLLWKAYAAGEVTEDEASELAGLIEARKAIPGAPKPAPRRVGSKPRTSESLERRRRWVAGGFLPPQIACQFTLGETAALAVIATEVAKRQVCSLTIGHIAGLAGVSETTVRNALRAAKALGLISIRERRLSHWRNDSNLIQIVSKEWLTWLRMGSRRGGCNFPQRTNTKLEEKTLGAFKEANRRKPRLSKIPMDAVFVPHDLSRSRC